MSAPLHCYWCKRDLPGSRPGEANDEPSAWEYCPHCYGRFSFARPQRTFDVTATGKGK